MFSLVDGRVMTPMMVQLSDIIWISL